jgi:hypothetical protein
MTRTIKWLGAAAAALLVAAAFFPWVIIESKHLTVTGLDTPGTNFGKPALFHFAMIFFFLLFTFIPAVWAKRFNLLVTALNLGWSIRNFFLLTACEGGECPVKKIGLYLSIACSAVMLISALFPDTKLSQEAADKNA